MGNLVIVNTRTETRVRPVRGGVAVWSAPDQQGRPQVRYNVRPGMSCGEERVCATVERTRGEGVATRVLGEAWDGVDQWVITKERFPLPPTPVAERAMIDRIRAEAERRIVEGVEIDGIRFRCDERSLSRIQAFAALARRLEADSRPVAFTFAIDAGVTVSLTSATWAEAVSDAATAHVGAILEKSIALQAAQATMTDQDRATFDETDDYHWTEE